MEITKELADKLNSDIPKIRKRLLKQLKYGAVLTAKEMGVKGIRELGILADLTKEGIIRRYSVDGDSAYYYRLSPVGAAKVRKGLA